MLQAGTECWVLYPEYGIRPVAEGIAGGAPPTYDPVTGNDCSYMMKLCEEGQQYVTVTRVHKKKVELMFKHVNSKIRNLDEVVAAPDVCDRMVRWSVRFLVDKAVVTQR